MLLSSMMDASLGRTAIRRTTSDTRGMTLVEVLVAVSILSIAIIVLSSLFPVAIAYQTKANYQHIASLDARSTLDWTLVSRYDNLTPGITTLTVPELPAGNTKTLTIQAYPTSDSTCLKLVTVRISWPGTDRAKYMGGEVIYRTLIAKPSKETDQTYADI